MADLTKNDVAKEAVIRDVWDLAWAKMQQYLKYLTEESEETRQARIRVIMVLIATAELVRQTSKDWPLGKV